jgi:hypothetical protein
MYGEKYICMAIIFHKNLRERKRRYGWRAGCILWKLEIKPCQSIIYLISFSSSQIG